MVDAVAPPQPEVVAPKTAVVPPSKDNTGVVLARPGTATGMSDAYSQAAQSGDPDKMFNFAKTAQGTEFEKPAMNAWRGMANRVSQFDDITSAIDKKGGPQSPQGKLEIANQWPKAQNEPSILRGLAEHLMGNPNARFFVSEGMITPKIIYDRAGKPLQQNWTESGVMKNVIDPITGREVLPDEYAQRGAGLTDTKETLPYIASKKQLDFNLDQANKAQHATNDIASAAPELASLHNLARDQMQKLWTSLGDNDLISPEERAQVASFGTRSVELGGSSSQNVSALDQYTRNGGQSLSNEQRKTLGAALKPFGMGVNADGEVVDKNGKHVDNSKLQSLQQSGAFGKTFDQSFSQTREDAINSLMFKKMNAQQQQQFGNILDIQKQIAQKNFELAQKHGVDANLPFLINPTLPNVADQYARFQVQQLVGQFNAEIAKDYADYRRDMLKNYPAGSAPSPGDIERAYSVTARYMNKRDEAKAIVRAQMNDINKTKSTKTIIAKEEVAGEVPQAAVEGNKPALAPITTKKPTTSNAEVNMPELDKGTDSKGFKVIRNPDREFKVKEPK